MATMNRTQFRRQLQEGLNTIFGMTYDRLPEEWPMVFNTETSRKAFEEDVLMTGFGPAPERTEGQPVDYDAGQEAWAALYYHVEIALAFAITRIAIEDGLYGDLSRKFSRALAHSFKETKEIKAINIFNNAFSGSFTGGDGKALVATDHPLTGGGTASNKLTTPADFAESSLESMLIQMRRAVDDRSLYIRLRPTKLVIPPEVEYDAVRVLRSTLRPASTNNDVNAINSLQIFNQDPVVLTRLTDADAWFILTDCEDGLKHFTRARLDTKLHGDFETDDVKFRGRERYSFGFTNWRCVWASEGAG